MQPFDPHGPTAPPFASPQVVPKRPIRPAVVVGACAATGLVALLLGIAIGRASDDEPEPMPAPENPKLARLGVSSEPVEANVLIDGRFVGVAPVERIDLDAGKHSVVIDAFGYQPYAGTLEVLPSAKMKLKVVLAPLGGKATTNGSVAGAGGTATTVVVPPSALLSTTGVTKTDPKAGGGGGSRHVSRPPRRDCSSEQSTCRDRCSRAGTDCEFRCEGCSSCTTSMGWDECNRRCQACRSGCTQNVKFCESGCESNYSSCTASQ